MYFKQFYLGCLAHASYLIGSGGEAAVVDPQRDIELYLEEAARQHLTIRHVIETHLHADFVSGHRELAQRTGARIYFGWRANAGFDHVAVRDGEEIRFGRTILRFLETPGHTPESISVLVIDAGAGGKAEAVLTGDTLFIGDVGRPDLLGAKVGAAVLAGQLYDSLHAKLLTLPDSVKVYPAHGAGSLCGRNLSDQRSSTIGQERRFNYALRPMSRERFVEMMTLDLPEAPAYFSRDAELNRDGPTLLADLPPVVPLPPAEVRARAEAGAVILDTRPSAQFGTSHIPGSIHIGLGGQFASWAGALITPSASVIVVTEGEAEAHEARQRLARVGLENVAGFLDGGIEAWDRAGFGLARTEQITVDELQDRLRSGGHREVLDVRRPAEWKAGHIRHARHLPLHLVRDRADEIPRDQPIPIICAGGYRSSIATSLLEARGFHSVVNVIGGMKAWVEAGHEVQAEP